MGDRRGAGCLSSIRSSALNSGESGERSSLRENPLRVPDMALTGPQLDQDTVDIFGMHV